MVAAVAAGAFVAAGAGQSLAGTHGSDSASPPLGNGRDAAAAFGIGGGAPVAPEIVPLAQTAPNPSVEVQKIAKGERLTAERAAREAEARRPLFVRPAQGMFTSGFGGRWGAMHYGVDIANSPNTPIVAAADGTVIEAGPASGFGLWVRIQLADGTINVYGHMNTFSVKAGQKVKAGQEIAKMGNRGFSTGYHLHFEVWQADGKKINPLPWLNERGIIL